MTTTPTIGTQITRSVARVSALALLAGTIVIATSSASAQAIEPQWSNPSRTMYSWQNFSPMANWSHYTPRYNTGWSGLAVNKWGSPYQATDGNGSPCFNRGGGCGVSAAPVARPVGCAVTGCENYQTWAKTYAPRPNGPAVRVFY